jgi:hypothetical protein
MRKLLGPSGYNRVMTNQTMPSPGFLKTVAFSRLGALATTVALTLGALAATAAPAQAGQLWPPGTCITADPKGGTMYIDCKTGKRLSLDDLNRRSNNGYLVMFAAKGENGVYGISLPKRLHGQTVTVTATFGTRWAPEWAPAQDAFVDDFEKTVTRKVRVTGSSIAVAIPNKGHRMCWGLTVLVRGEAGRVVKFKVSGGGGMFLDKDNGYTDITVLP